MQCSCWMVASAAPRGPATISISMAQLTLSLAVMLTGDDLGSMGTSLDGALDEPSHPVGTSAQRRAVAAPPPARCVMTARSGGMLKGEVSITHQSGHRAHPRGRILGRPSQRPTP